ncbi:MAG: hypothetical protein ACYC27_12685 [Armatimonadota bacterium]
MVASVPESDCKEDVGAEAGHAYYSDNYLTNVGDGVSAVLKSSKTVASVAALRSAPIQTSKE